MYTQMLDYLFSFLGFRHEGGTRRRGANILLELTGTKLLQKKREREMNREKKEQRERERWKERGRQSFAIHGSYIIW